MEVPALREKKFDEVAGSEKKKSSTLWQHQGS